MKNTIYFDMDGTIADLYGCDHWLSDLEKESTRPYEQAKPLVNMRALAMIIRKLQKRGYQVGIISWLSRGGSQEYHKAITKAKREWLRKHLRSVEFDEIHIIPHGQCKANVARPNSILFDDEIRNRLTWNGLSYDEKNLLKNLKILSKSS